MCVLLNWDIENARMKSPISSLVAMAFFTSHWNDVVITINANAKNLWSWKEKGYFFYQNFSLFSDYINLQNQINYYQFQKSTVHSLKINKYPQINYFWWFKMLCILGQLDKCGWNPSPGFDEVQSGVDISSWVKQQQFFQLGHFKRKSNLIISILNWLMQFHITQYYS